MRICCCGARPADSYERERLNSPNVTYTSFSDSEAVDLEEPPAPAIDPSVLAPSEIESGTPELAAVSISTSQTEAAPTTPMKSTSPNRTTGFTTPAPPPPPPAALALSTHSAHGSEESLSAGPPIGLAIWIG